MLCKKGILKNFVNFLEKSLCWSLFLIFLALKACKFIKKRLQHKCFPVKFAKFLRAPILKNNCERLFLKQKDSYLNLLKYISANRANQLYVTKQFSVLFDKLGIPTPWTQDVNSTGLIHSMLLSLTVTPENIRKPLVFWYFRRHVKRLVAWNGLRRYVR